LEIFDDCNFSEALGKIEYYFTFASLRVACRGFVFVRFAQRVKEAVGNQQSAVNRVSTTADRQPPTVNCFL